MADELGASTKVEQAEVVGGAMLAPPALTLRDATTDDEAFLFRVYAESRAEELAVVPWTAEHRHAFLRQQFTAQYRFYRERYDGASYQLVFAGEEPVGRLFVARWATELRIMDIALLAAHRDKGIGTRLLHALCDEADSLGQTLTAHVERTNRARRLYARVGFEERDDGGVYIHLLRPPGAR